MASDLYGSIDTEEGGDEEVAIGHAHQRRAQIYEPIRDQGRQSEKEHIVKQVVLVIAHHLMELLEESGELAKHQRPRQRIAEEVAETCSQA